jgi:uncharacterized coiled-coil DUF342 family protein
MIQLKQTATEYLLFIHASQRERAKKIEGRRWDPDRKCWVYPKTEQVLNALLAEFPEIRGTADSRRGSDAQSDKELKEQVAQMSETIKTLTELLKERDNKIAESESKLQQEDDNSEDLREQIAQWSETAKTLTEAIRERDNKIAELEAKLQQEDDDSAELRKQAAQMSETIKALTEAIRERDNKIAELEARPWRFKASAEGDDNEVIRLYEELDHLQTNITNQSRLISQLQGTVSALKQELEQKQQELQERAEEIAYLQSLLENSRKREATLQAELNRSTLIAFERRAKEIAKEAANGDQEFAAMMENLKLDDTLPNDVTEALRKVLLRQVDRPSKDLADLINQAGLPQDEYNLAHLIRKQRNIVVHKEGEVATYTARAMLCLFAASLLWPKIPR